MSLKDYISNAGRNNFVINLMACDDNNQIIDIRVEPYSYETIYGIEFFHFYDFK